MINTPMEGLKDWASALNAFLTRPTKLPTEASQMPEVGDIIFDSTLKVVRVWDGMYWLPQSPILSDTLPTDVLPLGTNWIDTSASTPIVNVLTSAGWVDINSGTVTAIATPPPTTPDFLADSGDSQLLGSSDSLADLTTRGNAMVQEGNVAFVIGYTQNSAINQNPQVARFDSGVQTWYSSDAYESGGADSQAVAVLWDKADALYVAFTIDGEQADSLSRFTSGGWIDGYGTGGGAKVSVLTKIDVNSGAITAGTYIRAESGSGETNTLEVKDLAFDNNGDIVVMADSFSFPLKADKSRFTCTTGSPYDYTLVLSPDLTTAVSAMATGCS